MEQKNFKKLSLFDLAAFRIQNASKKAMISEGDLVEIISPFVDGENFLGTVVEVTEKTMKLYHADVRKTIEWQRRVNCIVH